MISIVIPVYNEEATLRELHQRVVEVMLKQNDSYEIIFINDGSTDRTYEVAKDLRPLKMITLQRNYGDTPALDVGIQEAKGDIIIFMDADLQDDPGELIKMLHKLSEGCDVIVSWRRKRYDRPSRIIFSRFANMIVSYVLGVNIHDFGCGLKIYKSKFIKDFRLWGEAQVFLPAIAKERGARICEVEISHYPRKYGSSKIKISKMIKGGFDLISVAFFIKYFSKPLRFFGGWGLFSIVLSFTAFISSLLLRIYNTPLTTTPLPTVGTLFALTGVILFMLGLLAEIVLRNYYAVVGRSPYFIREIIDNGRSVKE
ncbi:MAG: glycosyltransferase family 2 protein [bacterium]|nr:glycosyltransferase family 2 protein [bacterium]